MILLLALFFCHFVADYSHLALPFQAAKRFGTPLGLIYIHASQHGLLMYAALLLCGVHGADAALLCLFEILTHFCIDTLKGRANGWFPQLQDPTKPPHWYVFGFDQFLHAAVIIIIWHLTQ